MKTLHIANGYAVQTSEEKLIITGRFISLFIADLFKVEKNGDVTYIESTLVTDSELIRAVSNSTGEAFDCVEYST